MVGVIMSIMFDHNDDVFRCLHGTMHVRRNAVVSHCVVVLSSGGRPGGRLPLLISIAAPGT